MSTIDRDQTIEEEHHEIAGGRIAEAARDRAATDPPAAPQSAPCWVHAGGNAPCRCFDEPPAPQPATPGQPGEFAAWLQYRDLAPDTTLAELISVEREAAAIQARFELRERLEPATPGELDLDAIAARAERAHLTIVALAQGANWKMSIPAQPERDHDLILDETVRDVERLVAEVQHLRRERQLLTDRWGHYKRQYLGALNEAQRRTAERDMLARAVVHPQRAVDATKLDAAPATDPTGAPQPATPGLRERVGYLVFCAVNIGDSDRAAALKVADQILAETTRADARDAGPGVYQLPGEPDVTELWDQSGDRWVRKQWPVHPDGSPAEPGTSWMWERNGLGERQRWPGLLAYGQLSTTPPAGTEGERREEEVDDAATE